MKTSVGLNGKSILVTGSPGFIGACLVIRLLGELGVGVRRLDAGTDIGLGDLEEAVIVGLLA